MHKTTAQLAPWVCNCTEMHIIHYKQLAIHWNKNSVGGLKIRNIPCNQQQHQEVLFSSRSRADTASAQKWNYIGFEVSTAARLSFSHTSNYTYNNMALNPFHHFSAVSSRLYLFHLQKISNVWRSILI